MEEKKRVSVLVVDDERQIANICVHFLKREGYSADAAYDGAEARRRIAEDGSVGVLFLDVRLPDTDGITLLKEIKRLQPNLEVVMITAHGTVDDAVACMKLGAADFIQKPFRKERLLAAAEQAVRVQSLRAEVGRLQMELKRNHRFEGVVAQSKRMRDLLEKLAHAAETDSTVLMLGESGTGKDLLARTIHYNGPRAKGPFIAVNCAALPSELIESELFGCKKGAFTGAVADSVGLFRAADGGTIFLDEIVDMPQPTQSKLLRVLQDRMIRPVGGTEERSVDVRVICATNREILKTVEQGQFRKDLYYRIGVISLTVPPLRERRDDIALLVEHFIRKCNERFRREVRGVEPAALEILKNHHWDGNVRELENTIEGAFALGRGTTITRKDLPQHIVASSEKALAAGQGVMSLREAERAMVERALKVSEGNISKAARLLGSTRKRVYNLLERHGIR
ncbi:MAG: sigma-54-dependent Fis family transcriptional regulator [Planctomycetes bacterium]|nr:sigma-54-dependent Fis family transcriptional regulator [Planctomycetota bacterium]